MLSRRRGIAASRSEGGAGWRDSPRPLQCGRQGVRGAWRRVAPVFCSFSTGDSRMNLDGDLRPARAPRARRPSPPRCGHPRPDGDASLASRGATKPRPVPARLRIRSLRIGTRTVNCSSLAAVGRRSPRRRLEKSATSAEAAAGRGGYRTYQPGSGTEAPPGPTPRRGGGQWRGGARQISGWPLLSQASAGRGGAGKAPRFAFYASPGRALVGVASRSR